MRKLFVTAASFAALLIFACQAQSQGSPGPGEGRGYLIDRHKAAAVGCPACHADVQSPKDPDKSICLGCHGTYAQIAAKTAADKPNPHATHLGEITCSGCHHVHRAPETICDQCHTFGMKPR
jgi:hypothetical protein